MSEDAYNEALIIASSKGHIEVVKSLLAAGADVNARSDDGWSPLIWAATIGRTEIVQVLLAVPGIDVNSRINDGKTALIQAAYYWWTETVQSLLAFQPQGDQLGIDVNARDNGGWSALMWSSLNGHTATVRALLAVPGIDVNTRTYYNGESALMLARNDEIRQLLLAHRDIDVGDPDFEQREDAETSQLLLAKENATEETEEQAGGKTRKLRRVSKCGGRTKHRKRHVKKPSHKRRKSKKNRF